jgi:hypothetical protein
VLEIDGNDLRCVYERPDRHPSIRIKIPQTVTIPARSEIIVNGKLHGKKHAKVVLVGLVSALKSFSRKTGLGVAYSVSKLHKGRIPVRLINLMNEEKMIEEDTDVGLY